MSNLAAFCIGCTVAFFFAHEPYLFCVGLGMVSLLTGSVIGPSIGLILFASAFSAVEPDFLAFCIFAIIFAAGIRRYFIFIR